MSKRILSIIIVLSMIVSLFLNCTVVSASEPLLPNPYEVKVEYYSDAELTTKIEEIDVGAEFYAVLEIKGCNNMKTFTTSLAYDSSMVELVTNGGTIPETGEVVFPSSEMEQYGIGIHTLNLAQVSNLKIINKDKLFVSGGTVANKPSKVLTMSWLNGPAVTATSEFKQILSMKLKAKAAGDFRVVIPYQVVSDDACDYCEYTNKAGIVLAEGQGVNTTQYQYISQYSGSIWLIGPMADSSSSIRLVLNATPIAAPTNLAINKVDKKVTWNAVQDAEKYTGKITVTNSNSNAVVTFETTDTFVNFANYSELSGLTYGDVAVEVKAVPAASATDLTSSENATTSDLFTVTLGDVVSVEWTDGGIISWSAVDNAPNYELTLIENGIAKTPVVVAGNVNSYDFNSEISDPVGASINSYKVSVKAVGDGTYVLSGGAKESDAQNVLGTVNDASMARWENETSCKGLWNDTNPANTVAGYNVVLKKNGTTVHTDYTTNAYYDFAAYMAEPGVYEFTVSVVGASVGGDSYKPSNGIATSNECVVSVDLEPVASVEWAGSSVNWVDNNQYPTYGYKVTVYKDNVAVGNTVIYNETTLDITTVVGTIQHAVYKVEVQVLGDNVLYMPSTSVTSAEKPFDPIADPANVTLTGNVATWDSTLEGITYYLKLYYNGVALSGEEYTTTNTTFTFPNPFVLPGEYSYTVQAVRNSSSQSAVVASNGVTISPARTGSVYVDFYSDIQNMTPVSTLSIGDVFYAAVSMKGTDSFDSIAIPFKFDASKVKVVGADNYVVADGVITDLAASGITLGSLISSFSVVENDTHPYIDNTNGLIKLLAYNMGGSVDASDTDKDCVLIIKLRAQQYSATPAEFGFAVAGLDAVYDDASISGFEFAEQGTPLFANIEAVSSFVINPGVLSKMQAPVWSGTDINWITYDSDSVLGYEIELYKNGSFVETITVNDPDANTLSLAAKVTGVGTYNVKIRAIGDANATSGEFSDMSDDYVKVSSSSRPSGSTTPVTPVTPVEPKPEFIDIDGHWAEEYILELTDLGILDGYGDGTFRPEIGITRAEFTKLMITCMGLEKKLGTGHVYDDTKNHWAKDYIALGTEIGIVKGIGDNLFAPDEIILREQVAAIIHRVADNVEVAVADFADRDKVEEYARVAVDYVAEKGIMIGYQDNTFRGYDKTTRAEMVTVLYRLLKAKFFD